MATALDIITGALLDLGVLADEESPSASQAAGGLRKLNNMIDSWNIQDLLVYGTKSYVFPLVSNKGTYTIGSGGDFNIPRPAEIQSAFLRDVNQPASYREDIPLWIYNDEDYQNVTFKGQTITQPYGIYFNYSFPLVNATLVPVPSTGQYSVVLYISGLINNLNLNDDVMLAPGYKRALEANLSIELASSYGVSVSQETVLIANGAVADLKVKNFQINELQSPFWGQYDIITNRVIYGG